MAREGHPHRIMSEAFEKRLKQLFPEPEYRYSFGKQIANGLKPDVYLRHPDGRQWAFEMVHANSQPDHLNDNHRRYQQAGIQDIWVLWDNLRPKIGVPLSVQQGIFIDLLPSDYSIAESKLTAPQQAILNMQPPGIRYLYSFSVSPLAPELDAEFLNMLSIGIDNYAFQSLGQTGVLQVTKTFISMFEMGFDEYGRPQTLLTPAFDGIELHNLLKALGYESNQALLPAAVIEQIIEMSKDPNQHPELLKLYLRGFLEQASPELIAVLSAFKNANGHSPVVPYANGLTPEISQQIFSNPEALQALANEVKAAQDHIAAQALPPALKQFLIAILNQPAIQDSADWTMWQTANPTLEKVKADTKKKKKWVD